MELEIPREVYLFCSNKILEEAKRDVKNKTDLFSVKKAVEYWTYKIMTNGLLGNEEVFRYTKDIQNLLDAKIGEIRHKLEEMGGQIESNPEWLEISPGVSYSRPREVLLGHKVTYKQYFTVVTKGKSPREVVLQYGKFLDNLIELFRYTRGLSIKYNDDVAFKFPRDAEGLLAHSDTLVVHYKAQQLSGIIREMVRDVMGPAVVELGRRLDRAKSGFDVHNIKSGEGNSHSGLISDLIALYFMRNLYGRRYGLTTQTLSDWIRGQVLILNNWPPEKLLTEVEKNRINFRD